MSDDERDPIEVARDVSKNWSGVETTPEGMLNEFELFGFGKRADILDQFDSTFRAADTSDLRKYYEFTQLRKNMQARHHTLRKAGR